MSTGQSHIGKFGKDGTGIDGINPVSDGTGILGIAKVGITTVGRSGSTEGIDGISGREGTGIDGISPIRDGTGIPGITSDARVNEGRSGSTVGMDISKGKEGTGIDGIRGIDSGFGIGMPANDNVGKQDISCCRCQLGAIGQNRSRKSKGYESLK